MKKRQTQVQRKPNNQRSRGPGQDVGCSTAEARISLRMLIRLAAPSRHDYQYLHEKTGPEACLHCAALQEARDWLMDLGLIGPLKMDNDYKRVSLRVAIP